MKSSAGYLNPKTSAEEMWTNLQIQTQTLGRRKLGKNKRLKYCLKIRSVTIKESDKVELLGITIDKALNFKKHIENLC